MGPMIAPYLPLITNRISFTLNPPPGLPSLTPRNEFLDVREPRATPSPSSLTGSVSSLKSSGSVVFGPQKETGSQQGKGKGNLGAIEEQEVQQEPKGNDEIIALIQKPFGEPGRPGSGGYRLEEVLDWEPETLSKVTVFVKQAAEKDLDTTVSYSKQNIDKVDNICKAAYECFPLLTKYAKSWPVRDILKLHLKYTSEAHRSRKNETPKKSQRPRRIASSKPSRMDIESEDEM
ncbi:hypothetical protein M413DRAFT_32960 [Hebeloma cylindrosporum]|uniref:Uncharacterized protein n=1 Tax=Hebeloma cylindrosporum TaxID=76867 RepID=A0A0C2XA07_HEBCY|nr:hypothetical protein M413DRAFT_32960 [Hebeloma cylindrosporum h7]